MGTGRGRTAGLGTPLAGAALIGVLTVAARAGHQGKGPRTSNDGWEYVTTLAAVGVALAATGPGRYSLDHVLGIERRGLRGAPPP